MSRPSDQVSPALEAMVARFAERVRYIGVQHGLAGSDVEDLVQEVRLRLWKALESGETRVGDAVQGEMIACVPLALDGEVSGAIVIRRPLAHKHTLEQLDFELFDLLARHAATALYCTSVRSRLEAVEVAQ